MKNEIEYLDDDIPAAVYVAGWPPPPWNRANSAYPTGSTDKVMMQQWEWLYTRTWFPVGAHVYVSRHQRPFLLFVVGVEDGRPTVTPAFYGRITHQLLADMGHEAVFECVVEAAARFTVLLGPARIWNSDPSPEEYKAEYESVRRRTMLAYRHDIDHEKIAEIVKDAPNPVKRLAEERGVTEHQARLDLRIWRGDAPLRRPLPNVIALVLDGPAPTFMRGEDVYLGAQGG